MKDLELSPKVLHKDHDDDILIDSTTPLLPAYITIEEFESLPAEKESREVFDKYYKLFGNVYLLSFVPYKISESEFNGGVFSGFYNEVKGEFILSARFLPVTVVRMLNRGEKPLNEYLFDREKSLILQRWFSQHPDNYLAPVFSYIAKIDTENYFFYRKPHEHVPGLMLIEMARQAMYHYVYSCSGYDRGDVSISMNNLGLSCQQYVISSYELELLVCHRENQYRNKPKTVDKIARFYQRGQFVGSLTLAGSVINTRLFKRLRNLSFPPTHWFKLVNKNTSQVVVTDVTGRCASVELQSISTEGVRLNTSPFDHYSHVNILLPNEPSITLPLAEYGKQFDDFIELKFAKLTSSQRNALSEFIKCKTKIQVYETPPVAQDGKAELAQVNG